MKKYISFVLALACVLGLAGCAHFNHEHEGSDNKKANLSEIALEEPLDPETSSGVGAEIAFESEDMLIFYGSFGLFGYDLKANELKFSIDFMKAPLRYASWRHLLHLLRTVHRRLPHRRSR